MRAEIIRRRPFRLRQIVLVLASFAFLCSFVFISRHRSQDRTEWIALEDEYPAIPEGRIIAHTPPLPIAHHPHPPQDTPHNATDDTSPQKKPDAVVFSLIMFSEDSASEGVLLLKSILMYSSMPVEFHIICDEPAKAFLETRLRLVTQPAHSVLVRFYLLSFASMAARIEREGAIMSDHSAGTPGLMKLFIHEILPDTVPRAIFIDTDAFFISDPALLWAAFARLVRAPAGPAVAIPTHPDQSAPEWHDANRICSCIMLLDLARLRALRLMDSSAYRGDTHTDTQPNATGPPALAPPAFAAMFGAPRAGAHYAGVKLGDQGYWWALMAFRPDLFAHLSFEWEVSSCLMDMYGTGLGHADAAQDDEAAAQVHTLDTPHAGRAVLPKMLHFNCLDGTPRFFEWEGWADPANSLTQRWWPAVQYHVGFKWIWLNVHQSDAALTIETEVEVAFADERYALARAQAQQRGREQAQA